MRSILLHIADDACLEARLQVALDLARSMDGHVTCVQATPYEFVVPGDFYGTGAAEIVVSMGKAADALRQRLEARLAGEDVAWWWQQESGPAEERLVARSGLSDVIVIGCCDPVSRSSSKLPGRVVARACAPILLVPPQATGLDCTGPALVAWDGSPEASHALRAATPLLARAERVILASVEEPREKRSFDLPATEGARYLSRYGVACDMVEFPAEDRSIAEVLTGAAAAHDAAYLVMGAYGRMRLSEMIWGGVTRELLASPPLPIFACH